MTTHRPRFKVPHVFVLLLGVIAVCSVLTWVIPSGSYDRETKSIEGHERTLLVPGTYQPIEKHRSLEAAILGDEVEDKASPIGLVTFLAAVPRGLEEAADIIFFIFIIGGTFGILQRTGVITASIDRLLRKLGNRSSVLTGVLMVVLGIGGSTLGMGEEFIPLIPVFLIVSKRLGYDRIYGMALVIVATEVGFAASTTNPFTVYVAQGIAELPLASGMPLRIVFFAVAMSAAVAYLIMYGKRIKANPSNSVMADDPFEIDDAGEGVIPYRPHHTWILLVSAAIFLFLVYAVQQYGWWMDNMAGGFLLMGILAAVLARLPLEDATKSFVKGMEEMVVAALVVGFAKGISVVLSEAQVMDTIVYGAASLLSQVPRYVAAVGMLFFESSLNLLIPSGSGQAAVTVPLMAPLSDILGISRQTAVFAFTCGDGFSNSVIPTSGILMAMLSLAKIPYGRWLKFMLPLFGILMGLSALFLIYAVYSGYS
ncbi:MAG: putative basic amino acid antiporter YfcC [bacterium]|nr:putative basic amino acid antiporter YfcC [bacterium]